MDRKILGVIFVSVFIAEMGDKTQLATMLLASDREAGKWPIFLGTSLALIAASGIGALAGSIYQRKISALCRRSGVCHYRPLDAVGSLKNQLEGGGILRALMAMRR